MTFSDMFSQATALHQTGRLDEAEALYQGLPRSDSNYPAALNALGIIQCQKGNPEEGLRLMDQAIAADPSYWNAHYDRGIALMSLARFHDALISFENAIAISPDPEAYWHKSIVQLLLGNYQEGWKLYEWRWKRSSQHSLQMRETPLWLGNESLNGKKVLVYAEQGFGDTLQFCRYLSMFPSETTVIFECFEEVVSLMQYNFPHVKIIKSSEIDSISYDYHVPLMSLPHAFGTTLKTIPSESYLRAQPEFVAKWRPIVDAMLSASGKSMRIGICWAGGQRPERADCLSIDAKRSLHFSQIKPLLDIENTGFLSLQIGPPSQEIDDRRVKDISAQILNWSDTAAIISQLDLVISADTSVCHLAAGMGKETFLLNRYDTCWRWLLNRDDSPWYPSLTQFRQQASGNWLEVIVRVKEAVATKAQMLIPEKVFSQATTLHQAGHLNEAEDLYRRLPTSAPYYVAALNALGIIQCQRGNPEEGMRLMNQAIAADPSYWNAHYDRGVALMNIARFQEALNSFECALKLVPDDFETLWNKGLLKLLLGEYEEGLQLYEWRWKRESSSAPRTFKQPLWLGKESIKNKTILLHAEQGYGDVIQFCRYVPLVETLGAKIILEVSSVLINLLATLNGNFQLVAAGSPLPAFDVHCPLPSLPLALQTRVETIPANIPYLFVNLERHRAWRQYLGTKTKPRIGIVWAGSSSNANDHNRSIALSQLTPLFQPNFEIHSLQKETRPGDEALLQHYDILSHAERLANFSDTSALIAEMDVIISVDTAVAHLAGALGKPVWILLPLLPDFRWMAERSDSPWYPTARLFRQSRPGDWNDIIEDVQTELRNFERVD